MRTARSTSRRARCSNWHGTWACSAGRIRRSQGWYDTDGNLVPETDIAERYHDEVVAKSGVRPFETGMGSDYRSGTDEEEAEVYLDHDVTFGVPTRQIADEYVAMDPEHTSLGCRTRRAASGTSPAMPDP